VRTANAIRKIIKGGSQRAQGAILRKASIDKFPKSSGCAANHTNVVFSVQARSITLEKASKR
jgi:hypothetical protein